MTRKIRIAHLAGPNATIANTPPLVTSNKARAKHGLSLLTDIDDAPLRFDVLRPQKIAAPVTVYVEQFSAHPLESDAGHLYGPADGYLNRRGEFSKHRRNADDRPVYEINLLPEDGYYPMPYMALRADGQAWETDGISARASRHETRQSFVPDGSRIFEEIDRFGISRDGTGNLIANKAQIDFFRIAPAGGYMSGLAARDRTDVGEGDILPEVPGRDFFPYRPYHLHQFPSRAMLARITNSAQTILSCGKYCGAIWTEGSPCIEETLYWLNLALDVTVPICGNSAQRQHGMISNDGPRNVADSVDYLFSKVWADSNGYNRPGVVLVQDQRIFAVRDVMKADARPGAYVITGGLGGVLGSVDGHGNVVLRYLPVAKHTYQSDVNITNLPAAVPGLASTVSGGRQLVSIKTADGELLGSSIPRVSIIKDASYAGDDDGDPQVDIDAWVEYKLKHAPLSGFVLEGWSPFGRSSSYVRNKTLERAAYSGFPIVCVGRGNTEGFALRAKPFIAGSNLPSTKARLLLMLCIMKFGMLPGARDPSQPTPEETAAMEKHIEDYQKIFDTH